MQARENYNDLLALLVVARERSFTRAAAQFGVSQPLADRESGSDPLPGRAQGGANRPA